MEVQKIMSAGVYIHEKPHLHAQKEIERKTI